MPVMSLNIKNKNKEECELRKDLNCQENNADKIIMMLEEGCVVKT